MTTQRDPETILAAWLDEGPTDLPDVTRRAILMALPTTSQARRGLFAPRRFIVMSNFSRPVLAVLVAALAIAGGIYVAASRSPGPTSSPAPTITQAPAPAATQAPAAVPTVPFTSARYGYSFQRPSDWQPTLSAADWAYAEVLSPESASLDRFFLPVGPAGTNLVGVASQPIAPDSSADAWLQGYRQRFAAANHGSCSPTAPAAWEAATQAARDGWILKFTCNGTFHLEEFIAVVGGRGWVVTGDIGGVDLLLSTLQIPG